MNTPNLTTKAKSLLSSQDACKLNQNFLQTLYIITHDLQAPLRGLSGFSSLLKQYYEDKLDEQGIQWLSLIEKNANTMHTMLEALLIYSRISSNEHKYENISLNDLINTTISEYINRAERPSIKTSCAIPSLISGVCQLWRLLLRSLIENSIRFQPVNQQATILINTKLYENHWCLLVEDNGIGVKENNYNKITEIFSRQHSQEDYPGIGMGLAYCQKIVELHYGTIAFSKSSLGGLCVNCSFSNQLLV